MLNSKKNLNVFYLLINKSDICLNIFFFWDKLLKINKRLFWNQRLKLRKIVTQKKKKFTNRNIFFNAHNFIANSLLILANLSILYSLTIKGISVKYDYT